MLPLVDAALSPGGLLPDVGLLVCIMQLCCWMVLSIIISCTMLDAGLFHHTLPIMHDAALPLPYAALPLADRVALPDAECLIF